MNNVQLRAMQRNKEILSSTEKIKRKIADNPDSPKLVGWNKRLSEYEQSLYCLSLEYETGKPVKLKDEKQQALLKALIKKGAKIDVNNIPDVTNGVVVKPGTAELNLVGKTPGEQHGS